MQKQDSRVCLFAHHDRRGRIASYVAHHLGQLRQAGFAVHIALSGMRELHGDDRILLDALGVIPHLRPNRGYDFGAWADLDAAGCADGADTVLLANDSVFGPLQPLTPIFETMLSPATDVWGMVESREGAWHLQSWFLCFTAAAYRAPAVTRVLRLPFDGMAKPEVVIHGELGLGAAIRADGLRWNARWRQPTARLRRLLPGNAMHLDFLSVLRSGAVPFVKVELLRDNPTAIRWVRHWRHAVAESALFPVSAIDAHLGDGGVHLAPMPPQSLRMRLLQALISRDWPEALPLSLAATGMITRRRD